jgi:hypothetical protein
MGPVIEFRTAIFNVVDAGAAACPGEPNTGMNTIVRNREKMASLNPIVFIKPSFAEVFNECDVATRLNPIVFIKPSFVYSFFVYFVARVACTSRSGLAILVKSTE